MSQAKFTYCDKKILPIKARDIAYMLEFLEQSSIRSPSYGLPDYKRDLRKILASIDELRELFIKQYPISLDTDLIS